MLYFMRGVHLLREGGEGEGAGGGGGASDQYTPPELDMTTALPPEYRDKEYFKGKDFVTLVKEHDNLQQLLGKRSENSIPKEDAAPEEWDAFLSKLAPGEGEYELPETEYSKTAGRDDKYKEAVQSFLKAANTPKRLAGKLVEGFESLLLQGQKMQAEQKEAEKVSRETEFGGLLDKTFGTEKQKVLDRTQTLMTETIPAEHKELAQKVFDNISNEALFGLTLVLDGIHKKYVSEDDVSGDGVGGGDDPVVLEKQARDLMASKAYNDFREVGHQEARETVQKLFQRVAALRKK